MEYLSLILAAACPVIVSAVLYLVNKKTRFRNLDRRIKQLIYGLVFGILSILGSELGVRTDGAIINVRDAAPLAAGLIFGAPSGIISGLIGGLERWLSVFWGGGEFMRFAGAVSTILAGFFGAVLREWMFDDKKPAWYYGFAVGFIMEVLHMLMLFFIDINDVKTAFTYVGICAFPMITANSLSVMFSLLAVSALSKEKRKLGKEHKKLTQTFSRWLLIVVLVSFMVTSVFTFILQSSFTRNNNKTLLMLNINDVKADIEDASDANLLALTHEVAKEIDAAEQVDNALLHRISAEKGHDFSEINVVNQEGFITGSTTEGFLNFDMKGGKQSGAFMVLTRNETEYVQSYQPISLNKVYMKYAGVRLKNGGFVQVGYDADRFHKDIDDQVVGVTRNRHVGEKGFMIIASDEKIIVSDPHGFEGQHLDVLGFDIDTTRTQEKTRFISNIHGEECYCMYTVTEGYYIIAAEPVKEVLFSRDLSVYLTVSMGILIFTIIFVLLYFLVKKLVVENIHEINNRLKEITRGNLNVSVNVRTNEEFVSLSNDINSTVSTLKRYISEAAARIDKELEVAKIIQTSTLPNAFPAFPERTDLDIYARMDTAKEVGGDFYDFYLLDDNHLAFLIADVSGKGITAAMFMMKAKTLIKSYAEKEETVVDIMTKANEALCDSNSAEMFVTCWMGILDFTTHTVSFVNAGHNPPLIRHEDGAFEYFKSRPGFVLGGMEGIRYRMGEFKLYPGDEIFLYTDGITEATDSKNELYGEDRLISIVNSLQNDSCESLCKDVKEDIDRFVAEAPQFDDMTMLCLKLTPKNMIRIKPDRESMEQALAFVEGTLEKADISPAIATKISISVDEVYSNIINYSNADEAEIECSISDEQIILKFTDNGKPYDPMGAKEPDITLSAEERSIGGLGIFMVKKFMDSVSYSYRSDRNILTLKKNL